MVRPRHSPQGTGASSSFPYLTAERSRPPACDCTPCDLSVCAAFLGDGCEESGRLRETKLVAKICSATTESQPPHFPSCCYDRRQQQLPIIHKLSPMLCETRVSR